MKKIIIVISSVLLMNITANSQEGRQRFLMDFSWKFNLGDVEQAQQPEMEDGNWRELNLPHDWSIEGAFSQDAPAGGRGGYLPGGIGWYRKTFMLPPSAS